MEKRKLNLLSKINDMDEASRMIKKVSLGFYLLSIISGGIGFILILTPLHGSVDPDMAYGMIIESIIIALLALLLHLIKSRIAGILLFLMSLLSVFTTIQNKFSDMDGGGNILLALIFLLLGIRAVEASFKYRKYKKDSIQTSSRFSNV